MPLYEFHCEACGRNLDKVVPLADFDKAQQCLCGAVLSRLISAPSISVDYPAYQCPVSGKEISGRRQHEENLKRTNCRIWEPGETEQVRRNKKMAEDNFAKSISDTFDSELARLPSQEKKQLMSELASGVDLAVKRTSPN